MKAGTTSLHYYLDLHPEVAMSRPKELNFFVASRNWAHGTAWYRSHFEVGTKRTGESSPNYTKSPMFPGVAARMARVAPDARLIYLVRNPLRRLVSHYVHNVVAGRELRTLAEVVHRRSHYVLCGQYHYQLRPFLDHYPQSSILVLRAEDLRSQRRRTIQAAYRFLGLDSSFSHSGFAKTFNRTRSKSLLRRAIVRPRLTAAVRERLRDWYAPDANRLREAFGVDIWGSGRQP
jgi:hypothetical protein